MNNQPPITTTEARRQPCDTCDAKPGEPCVTKKGNEAFPLHSPRYRRAEIARAKRADQKRESDAQASVLVNSLDPAPGQSPTNVGVANEWHYTEVAIDGFITVTVKRNVQADMAEISVLVPEGAWTLSQFGPSDEEDGDVLMVMQR
jgi:hypothetical protein